MLQARNAVKRRSWSHPQEPTGEEWWADVLADPRARKRERRTTVIAEIAGRGTMLTLGFAVMAPMRPTNRNGPVGHSRSGRVVGEGRCGRARVVVGDDAN